MGLVMKGLMLRRLGLLNKHVRAYDCFIRLSLNDVSHSLTTEYLYIHFLSSASDESERC